MAKNRSDSNSVAGEMALIKDAEGVISPPDGYTLDSVAEEKMWNIVTSARAKSDWRQIDLLIVHKIVKCETKLRDLERQLEMEGDVIENARGTPMPNPLASMINTQQQRQITLLLKINVMQNPISAKDLNARGVAVEEKRKDMENARTGKGAGKLLAI